MSITSDSLSGNGLMISASAAVPAPSVRTCRIFAAPHCLSAAHDERRSALLRAHLGAGDDPTPNLGS